MGTSHMLRTLVSDQSNNTKRLHSLLGPTRVNKESQLTDLIRYDEAARGCSALGPMLKSVPSLAPTATRETSAADVSAMHVTDNISKL
jgi:hypothetical protein